MPPPTPAQNADESPSRDHLLSNKFYDILKFLAQIVFPALGTLYFTLAGIWGLPAPEQVVGTIVAVDTFLGVLLHISTTQYTKSDARFDGDMLVSKTSAGKTFTLNLNGDPAHLEHQKEVRFKVKPTETP